MKISNIFLCPQIDSGLGLVIKQLTTKKRANTAIMSPISITGSNITTSPVVFQH